MTPLFETGIQAFKEGRFEEALGALAETVRRAPTDHRARLMAARALGELGERERALLALNAVAENLLRRNYLLLAILAVKLGLRFNPTEKLLKQTLARVQARALASRPSLPPEATLPLQPLDEGAHPTDLTTLHGSALVAQALAVLMSDDAGPPDMPKRQPLPLLAELEPAAFLELAERMAIKELADGQPVVKEGDPGTSIFIVVSGKARVVREEEPPRQLATLVGGALFGELSVLTGAPRSASVHAMGEVELFEITRDDLDFVARAHPSLPMAIAEFAQRRLAMNLLATAPLFTQLETAHRGKVLQRFSGRIVNAGERVIAEGEPSPGLFLVLSGELTVTKRDAAGEAVALKVLGDGDVFGEISMLSGGPASATVTAVRKCATAFLPRASYDELVQSYPQVEDFLMQLSQQRLSANAAAALPAEVMDAEELVEG